MKKFLNISPKESKGLDKTIYKNALNLKKDAILIAEKRKSFSSASSLLILSTEECVKSILVLLHSESYNVYQIKDAKKFFSDHVIRHQIAMFIVTALGFQNVFKNGLNLDPKNALLLKSQKFDDLLKFMESFIPLLEPIHTETSPDLKYLQDFNLIKNKGFYVDYIDKLFVPKEKVTFDDYAKVLSINYKVLKFYKQLRVLFHEKIENHMEKEDIKLMKNYLKDFIDNGMKMVEFSELKKK